MIAVCMVDFELVIHGEVKDPRRKRRGF